MTQKTAKEVFDILLAELRSKGFTDVGTLLIDNNREGQYSTFLNDDNYHDTNAQLLDLEMQSRQPQRAIYALRRLVEATIEYFQISSSIPRKFQGKLEDVGFENPGFVIKTETLFGEEENYNAILKNSNVDKMLEMLELIQASINLDDDEFNKRVNTL